jgi:hypothetical protein
VYPKRDNPMRLHQTDAEVGLLPCKHAECHRALEKHIEV